MRSKSILFGLLLVAVALSVAVMAGANQKLILSGPAVKYGAVSENPVSQPVEPSTLPPVGSRGRNGLDEVIISEDFESVPAGQLPAGWIQVDVDQGSTTDPSVPGMSIWRVFNQQGLAAHSGTRLVGNHYNDGALPNNDWLILPQQNLTGTITLSYWAASQDPNYLESYEVRVSTTGTQPANFTNLIQAFTNIPTAYTQHTHDLSQFAGAPFYIAFHYNSIDEFVLKIDDVLLEGTQAGTFGSISGTVTDASTNAPISNVQVRIPALSLTTTTNASGAYNFASVTTGTYDVLFSHLVYISDTLEDVAVTLGQNTTADIALVHSNVYYFESTANPVPIFDGQFSAMELSVNMSEIIFDVDVIVNITHTWDGDLDLWIVSPAGDSVQLYLNDINISGDNFTNTRFDDEATTHISAGSPPYTGSFRPVEELETYDGFMSNGTWRLVAYDNNTQDTGMILGFALLFEFETVSAGTPGELPASFAFHGNYPNPFNATTNFSFDMNRAGHASLVLYNVVGEKVATLVDRGLEAGSHAISFDAGRLPSGVYLARFTAPGFAATQKVVLLK